MDELLRLRPFTRRVQLAVGDVALVVTGQIERDSFVISTFGQRVAVPIREANRDERGTYVLVDPGEHHAGKAVVELTPEYDEFTDGQGAQISIGLAMIYEITETPPYAVRASTPTR